jgi:hypothetical protein
MDIHHFEDCNQIPCRLYLIHESPEKLGEVFIPQTCVIDGQFVQGRIDAIAAWLYWQPAASQVVEHSFLREEIIMLHRFGVAFLADEHRCGSGEAEILSFILNNIMYSVVLNTKTNHSASWKALAPDPETEAFGKFRE